MHTYSGEFIENTYFNLLDRNVGKKVSLFDFYRRIWVRLNYGFVVAVFFFLSTQKSCLQVINIHGIGKNLDK